MKYKIIVIVLIGLLLDLLALSGGAFKSYDRFISFLSYSCFFISILYYLDLKKHTTLEKNHFVAFRIPSTAQLYHRMYYLYTHQYYLIFVILHFSIVFFEPEISLETKILFFMWGVLQTNIAVLFLFIIKDYADTKNLSKHILVIPSLYMLLATLGEKTGLPLLILLNPVQTGCAIPGYFSSGSFVADVFLSIFSFILISGVLIFINKILNKNWAY